MNMGGHPQKHGLGDADHDDIEITSPSDGQVLSYEQASSKWKNVAVSVTDPLMARMYKVAAQSIPKDTWTVQQFDTGQYDNGSLMGTNRFDITVDGVYIIMAGQGFAAHATGRRLGLISLNGGTIAQHRMRAESSLPDYTQWIIATEYKLVDGDYIEFKLWQNSGANLNSASGVSGHWASIRRVGDG